jgi:hypothetical protein
VADYLEVFRDLGGVLVSIIYMLIVGWFQTLKPNSDDACDSTIVNWDCVWTLVIRLISQQLLFIGMIALAGYGAKLGFTD